MFGDPDLRKRWNAWKANLDRTLLSYAARPTCEKCGKPVEELQVHQDPEARVVVYTARCHGEVETCELPQHLFEDATQIRPGTAFARRQTRDGQVPQLPERAP